jgi:phospholipid transport system substrate-binding protein
MRMSSRILNFGPMILLAGLLAAGPSAAEPAQTPEQVIIEATQLGMAAIEGRREELRRDPDALFAVVDEILLPRWDRQATAQAVMGRYWREATTEQREAFIIGLYRKLLDSYGEGILRFEGDRFQVLGTRGNPAEGRVLVDAEFRMEDGTRVPMSYRMRLHQGHWKVFDVIIEGISYLTTYRNQYAAEFRAKGVQGVIDELRVDAGTGGG